MEAKLNPKERELYRRVDEVLYYLWDPLGVNDAPLARDEYYTYLPKVFNLVKASATETEIAKCLGEIQSVPMGCPINRLKNDEIAGILVHWREITEESSQSND